MARSPCAVAARLGQVLDMERAPVEIASRGKMLGFIRSCSWTRHRPAVFRGCSSRDRRRGAGPRLRPPEDQCGRSGAAQPAALLEDQLEDRRLVVPAPADDLRGSRRVAASRSSRVCSSRNWRTFSMAMTACAANVSTRAIWSSAYGPTSRRYSDRQPIPTRPRDQRHEQVRRGCPARRLATTPAGRLPVVVSRRSSLWIDAALERSPGRRGPVGSASANRARRRVECLGGRAGLGDETECVRASSPQDEAGQSAPRRGARRSRGSRRRPAARPHATG